MNLLKKIRNLQKTEKNVKLLYYNFIINRKVHGDKFYSLK